MMICDGLSALLCLEMVDRFALVDRFPRIVEVVRLQHEDGSARIVT